MSGKAATIKFLSTQKSADAFITQNNPYDLPFIGINIQALCRYAEKKGVSVSDLKENEIQMFQTAKANKSE